jgi:DNA polymerase III subunit beta
MKLKVVQSNLTQALSAVGRIVGSRTTLPVLGNVLLSTDGTRLKLSTTNLEIGINYWVGAKVEKPGAVTVPARLLADYVANLPSETLEISLDKNLLKINAGHFQSAFNTIAADEFPSIPTISKKASLSIDFKTLHDALTQVALVASIDDARPVLSGVYFETSGNKLILAATDSYRLAEKRLDLETKPAAELKVIVPVRTIQELLRANVADDQVVEIMVEENQILFRLGEIELISRLIDGDFPDYQQLIPKEADTVATIGTAEFSNVAKVASLFAQENAGSVSLSVSAKPAGISIKSIASQIGENVSEAEAEVEGEDAEVALNCRYLLDALSVMHDKSLSFAITGKVNPCVLKPAGDKTYVHIIMPLRS